MNAAKLIDAFGAITQWKRGDQRAPHKPLLALYALARLQRGEPRLIPYAELGPTLKRLLQDFGPPRRANHPEYPFWYLQSDGLWEVSDRARLEALAGGVKPGGYVPVGVLMREDARAGLPPEVDAFLRQRPSVVNDIANHLLIDNFPPSLHEAILDAVAMPFVVERDRKRRDPAFREHILRIYEHRCAVCGYDGRLGHTDLGLEAAHVKWVAAHGPDAPDNGLALCSFHHVAFDRGAIGLTDDHRVLVSQDVHGRSAVDVLLLDHTGRPLVGPQRGAPPPAQPFVQWHRREVFREPARAA